MLSKLLHHTSNYSIGSLLVTLASLVSFPFFTRIFTVDEYGLMNLVSATLAFLVGFGKLGIQHSIVRLHDEVASGKHEWTLAQFYSTAVWGMGAVGLAVTIAWAGLSQLVPDEWWNDARVRGLLLLTAVLVLVRVVDNSLVNLLRADLRSGAFAIYQVTFKYVNLAIIILTLTYISRSLQGLYAASIVTEILATLALAVWLLRHRNVSPSRFSPGLFRAMVVFGVPMLGFEIARLTLNLADRYLIQAMLGGEALGHYSAAYNLCEYVQMVAIASVGQAIMPIYVRLWEQNGEGETRRFIRDALRYYLLFGMPMIAGLSAVGEDVLVLLASEKYREGAVIIPWVMGGIVIQGAMVMLAAGLYIHKHTTLIMARLAVTALLNVALNLVLIPRYGIVGAAVATLASYIALIALTSALTRRRLPISMPWTSIARYGLFAVMMYLIVTLLPTGQGVMMLTAKIVVGIVSYGLMVLSFDRKTSAAMFAAVRARMPRP